MGLIVHSLNEFPLKAERDYYIYLLRGSWDDEITQALQQNFLQLADMASRNNAAVIRGTEGHHFGNEVFDWHHLNGIEREDFLPSIVITTLHPAQFRDEAAENWRDLRNDHLLAIPLKDKFKSARDITALLARITKDIKDQKPLRDFSIAEEMRAGVGGAVMDAFVLRPTIAGFGVDLKALASAFKKRKA